MDAFDVSHDINVFIANFEHVYRINIVFIVDFEQVITY